MNAEAPHINIFEPGQHGRYRTNAWNYRGVNTMRTGRMEELALHPTVKPVQLIAVAIRDVSGRGEIVLDLFGGSGSTLIAAEKTGRNAILAEKTVLEDSVAQLRQVNETEADAEEIADNLRYIALGEEKLALVRKIMPG